ncbi:hypothetical protein [Tengunoibacter tsumagoiensis]|uniref:hypothetical protein n=1 Tax=Tengunoibacter tsumagoiensis TaxID=2014871 RepID=UPI000F843774|nr:hypothetical protein [Tengunoibacter tsumagoiensis]
MMRLFRQHCILCHRSTMQHCSYCHEPICVRCRTVDRGRIYCSPRHRDSDSGPGRLARLFERSLGLRS